MIWFILEIDEPSRYIILPIDRLSQCKAWMKRGWEFAVMRPWLAVLNFLNAFPTLSCILFKLEYSSNLYFVNLRGRSSLICKEGWCMRELFYHSSAVKRYGALHYFVARVARSLPRAFPPQLSTCGKSTLQSAMLLSQHYHYLWWPCLHVRCYVLHFLLLIMLTGQLL
jgi:hypothetical protein